MDSKKPTSEASSPGVSGALSGSDAGCDGIRARVRCETCRFLVNVPWMGEPLSCAPNLRPRMPANQDREACGYYERVSRTIAVQPEATPPVATEAVDPRLMKTETPATSCAAALPEEVERAQDVLCAAAVNYGRTGTLSDLKRYYDAEAAARAAISSELGRERADKEAAMELYRASGTAFMWEREKREAAESRAPAAAELLQSVVDEWDAPLTNYPQRMHATLARARALLDGEAGRKEGNEEGRRAVIDCHGAPTMGAHNEVEG